MVALKLILLVLALVLFGVDAYMNVQPTRLTSAGLCALVASMLSW